MRELAPLSPSPAAPAEPGGRSPGGDGFAALLGPAHAEAAPASQGAPHEAASQDESTAASGAAEASHGLSRPDAVTGRPKPQGVSPEEEPAQAASAGAPRPPRTQKELFAGRRARPDTSEEPQAELALEQKPSRKGRQGHPDPTLLLAPTFATGPQPTRAAQAGGALQLKGTHVTATKLTGRPDAREPAHAKPSAPETGDLPSHRPGATPTPPQPPSAAAGATSLAELAAPPPVLPAPLVQAALDLPGLHLSILPTTARLSVSTEEGDVRVQLRVKDSVANVRVEGPGASAFQRAPDELRVVLAQAGLSLGSFELGGGDGQQRQERPEHVVPFEMESAPAGFVTRRAQGSDGTEGEKAHPRQVRVRA